MQQAKAGTATTNGFGGVLCFTPNAEAACGFLVYNKLTQRCCSSATGVTPVVQWNDSPCPCTKTLADATGTSMCPTNEPLCCQNTKYQAAGLTYNGAYGQCYNPTIHQCCETGHRFDPGASQCCPINGIQSLDVPCPCSLNTHCIGNKNDTTDDVYFSCCMASNVTSGYIAPQEILYTRASGAAICDIYANFPSGTGPASLQPCLGTCLDTRFQTCCNGATCIKNVEYCCNSTCCNKYVGTCSTGRRPGTPGQWQNPTDFGTYFTQCSTIEQMNTIKAFWIFVLPTELMFASFFCLAIVLAFAARAKDSHEFFWLERFMIVAAIAAILFSVATFFAPIYKYGVVVVIVSLFAIITASARVRWLNILCVFFHLVALFYLFDFVDGNFYLELNSNRNFVTGATDPDTMGVLHAIKKMFPSPQLIQNALNPATNRVDVKSWCITYYNYFQFDMQVRDWERVDNPFVSTFGYCSRAWSVALYLFVAAIMDLVVLQFIMDIIGVIVRFQHITPSEIIEKDE
jgi:hypothetical protein